MSEPVTIWQVIVMLAAWHIGAAAATVIYASVKARRRRRAQ